MHATEAHGGVEVQFKSVLTSAPGGGLTVTSSDHFTRGSYGTISRVGHSIGLGVCPYQVSNHDTAVVQPVASHYTD